MAEHTESPPRSPTGARARVGRYVLVEAVGRGGMGEVHRARAYGAEGVTKELCIKQIRRELVGRSPEALARFVDEARIASRLSHGNVVSVFDFGRAGEAYYLAMEWVEGADLRALVRDADRRGEPLPAHVAAHAIAEVARALAYAHELPDPRHEGARGVVHSDVKPANVLVSISGDVKLTDFGVAVARDDVRRGGTEGYVAPELARGEPATPATDLFSLGVALVESITGARGDSAAATRVLARALPPALRALAERLLADDPAARPASAAEVAGELGRWVARAHADGGVSPRDELARRAQRISREGRGLPESGELDASASYLRDGESVADVLSRTGSTVSSARVPEPEPAPDAPREQRRAPAWWLAPLAVLAAIALWASFAPGTRTSDTTPARAVLEVDDRSTPPDERSAVTAPTEEPERVEHAPEATGSTTAEPVPDEPVREEEAREAPRTGAHRARAPRQAPTSTAAETEVREAEVLTGRLRVNAIPWASVELDGAPIGITPLLGLEVSAGDHVLRLENAPLGRSREVRVRVEPGATRDVVVDLDAP